MKIIYNISIRLYAFLAKIVANFNSKAKLRKTGLVNSKLLCLKMSEIKEPRIWVHCASLGEFEQARPLIEEIKKEFPLKKLVLTFFSPSGYELRKDYELADYVLYLPYDIKKNARKFVEQINPEKAIFIKYEFWYWFIFFLKKNNIPVYLVSGIFRKEQVFFKFYGNFFRGILKQFDFLFLQNSNSKELLDTIDIQNNEITGDTRFDRVVQLVNDSKDIPKVIEFKNSCPLFIAGSSWEPDEKLIIKYINESFGNIKYIIAPHEINNEKIKGIQKLISKKSILFSEINEQNINNYDVLIINNIGLLSSLYAYADVAYIGGGFGVGIHNTLEAATYGLPVIFGPKYEKFQEAVDLIDLKAAYSIKNYEELESKVSMLFSQENERKLAGGAAEKYVKSNAGATQKVMNFVFK